MHEYGSLPKRLRRNKLVELAMQLMAAAKKSERFHSVRMYSGWLSAASVMIFWQRAIGEAT